jgi:hypothetical protein
MSRRGILLTGVATGLAAALGIPLLTKKRSGVSTLLRFDDQ